MIPRPSVSNLNEARWWLEDARRRLASAREATMIVARVLADAEANVAAAEAAGRRFEGSP